MTHARLDDIVSLAFFARVVESGSFANAARCLGVTRAAVSHRVRALEERCAVRLFHRTTRRVELTKEAEALYLSCAELTRAADASAPQLDGLAIAPAGELRVAAPACFGTSSLIAALPSFCAVYPNISVNLSLNERSLDLAAPDLVIRSAHTLPLSSHRQRPLGVDEIIVCAAPHYLASAGVPETVEELGRHACVQLQAYNEWTFARSDELISVPISGKFRCDSLLAVKEAATLGLGLARLPRSLIGDELQLGSLVGILEEQTRTLLQVFALFPVGHAIPPKVVAFVDHLVSFLARANEA